MQLTEAAPESAVAATASERDYLTFLLAEEEYGLNILSVQEIRRWEYASPIPEADDSICGVINLRGDIIPIVDLRKRLKKESAAYTHQTVVIVVTVRCASTQHTVGLVVDRVSEVRRVKDADLRSPADLTNGRAAYVSNLATIGGKLVILLNVDHLVDFWTEQKS